MFVAIIKIMWEEQLVDPPIHYLTCVIQGQLMLGSSLDHIILNYSWDYLGYPICVALREAKNKGKIEYKGGTPWGAFEEPYI